MALILNDNIKRILKIVIYYFASWALHIKLRVRYLPKYKHINLIFFTFNKQHLILILPNDL